MKKTLSVFLCVIVLFLLGSVVCFATPASYSLYLENREYVDSYLDSGRYFTTCYDFNGSSSILHGINYLNLYGASSNSFVSHCYFVGFLNEGDPLVLLPDVQLSFFREQYGYAYSLGSYFLLFTPADKLVLTDFDEFYYEFQSASLLFTNQSDISLAIPLRDPWDVVSYDLFDPSVSYELGYSDGYSEGRLDGQADPAANRLIDVLKAVIEAPFFLISKVFDVNIFGINIAGVIFSLLSITIAYFVIKFILKVVK